MKRLAIVACGILLVTLAVMAQQQRPSPPGKADFAFADGKTITINWNFSDTKEQYVLALENGALNHTANKQAKEADATLTLTRAALDEAIMGGKPKLEAQIASGEIKIEGHKEKMGELLSLMDKFDPWFNIVTP